MRDYITSFFEEFEYERADRVALAIAYEKIAESKKARDKLLALISGYERDNAFIKLESRPEVEAIATAAGIHPYTAILLTVICLSRTLRARLAAIGIPKKVIYNTLCDFKYKLNECKTVHGVVGTEHFDWYVRFFELRLFAIGRLQFQLKAYSGDSYEKDGKRLREGDRVLAVHIPDNSTPLEERACNQAFRDAKKLFCALLKISDIPFICSSWLLYPKNREFLPEKSNIVKFMNKFDLISTANYRKDNNTAIPFLFHVKKSTPTELLPRGTSLQRAYAGHLMNGGKMGYGVGVMFVEEKNG